MVERTYYESLRIKALKTIRKTKQLLQKLTSSKLTSLA